MVPFFVSYLNRMMLLEYSGMNMHLVYAIAFTIPQYMFDDAICQYMCFSFSLTVPLHS